MSAAEPGGFFTPKCNPGAVTATAGFVQTACGVFGSQIRITITFSGPCPCGSATWCAVKQFPGAVVTSSTSSLAFGVGILISSTTAISGQVALGCTDRDGDTRFAAYAWTMTATDDGGPCSSANSVSAVSLNGPTLIDSPTCPLTQVGGLNRSADPSFNVGGPRR